MNQWNASGRVRDPNEIYISYLTEDRKRSVDFFLNRDEPFTLLLPDGTEMSAKVCQRAFTKVSPERYAFLTSEEKEREDARAKVGKSIMSNPNKALGKWLLRDVFELPEKTLVIYDMLRIFGVDSVMFTKLEEKKYRIDFCVLGTYEKMYHLDVLEQDEE